MDANKEPLFLIVLGICISRDSVELFSFLLKVFFPLLAPGQKVLGWFWKKCKAERLNYLLPSFRSHYKTLELSLLKRSRIWGFKCRRATQTYKQFWMHCKTLLEAYCLWFFFITCTT